MPDAYFDRQWALTILDRALAALAAEHHAAGKADQFETLKPWLTGESEHLSQAEAARRLDVNEGAVKVAIHRLRKRFRELVKAEICRRSAAARCPSRVGLSAGSVVASRLSMHQTVAAMWRSCWRRDLTLACLNTRLQPLEAFWR